MNTPRTALEELLALENGSPLRFAGACAQYIHTHGKALSEALGGWLPIETAPKDGTVFIAWRFYAVAVRWVDDPEFPWEAVHLGSYSPLTSNGFVEGDCNLTHWRPLPPPPTSANWPEAEGG